MGCNCGKRGGSSPSNNCGGTTAQTLSLYLSGYQRVQNENLYNDLGVSEDYVQQQIQLINESIIVKQSSSTSCSGSQFYDTWAQDYAEISLL
jgi:hypothetical protein